MSFDYGNKKDNGQWEHHPTNTEGGYVAPIRRKYTHNICGALTKISTDIAETYAKNPRFYGRTFCTGCHDYFPIHQFRWDEDGVPLGEIGIKRGPELAVEEEEVLENNEDHVTIDPQEETKWIRAYLINQGITHIDELDIMRVTNAQFAYMESLGLIEQIEGEEENG